MTPAAIAVKIEDVPPAELLACPPEIEGFPIDAVALMPAPVRFAAIRVVTAYAAMRAQLDRLIAWNAPGSCAAPGGPR